ncbi:MAG: hypothetical protein LBH13_10810 [Cellulomonadaceae bacterium]|nr:hypothetical protein [Cellulomonadaceae bacterium]
MANTAGDAPKKKSANKAPLTEEEAAAKKAAAAAARKAKAAEAKAAKAVEAASADVADASDSTTAAEAAEVGAGAVAAAPKKARAAKATVAKASKEPKERIFTPTPEAKAKATRNRIIAWICWALAIAGEAVAIFVVLRPSADDVVAHQGFPQNRWWVLIAMIVVIGALAVAGSLLWKKANRLDPASRKDTVRFFVQNQLGAIVTIIAFLPLIILIFLNKDMDQKQKTIAGIIGIVVALGATAAGVDTKPFSQEQAAVESQVVTSLTGKDEVFFTAGGKVMHLCEGVSDLANSTVESGTTAEAFAEGKQGITLKLTQELNQCGLAVPANIDEITDWVRTARGERAGTDTGTDTGTTDTGTDTTDDTSTEDN